MSKSILVYSSIGDVSTFFPMWKHQDIKYAFNYYKHNEDRKKIIESSCDYFTNREGTKFNLFSKIYDKLPSFDYYVLIDDDINLKGEDIIKMVESMEYLGLGIGSPSHSPEGRISWRIMRTRDNSEYREVDFVEMTVVIFNREEMERFLEAYVPYRDRMIGWGVDHIIHSVCSKPFVIFDNISIINPTNEQKGISQREILSCQSELDPRGLWFEVLADPNNNFTNYSNR